MVARLELHCHTRASKDGFTTFAELKSRAMELRLSSIAITEHDRVADLAAHAEAFASAGIQLIPGVEVTTTSGTHIVGLFVRRLPSQRDVCSVVDAIVSEGGIVSIPHPLKPGSGLLSVDGLNSPITNHALSRATLFELYNGGWNVAAERVELRSIASDWNLRAIGASDSHKWWQIGRLISCVTFLGTDEASSLDITPGILRSHAISMLALEGSIVQTEHVEAGWRRRIQRSGLYQLALRSMPYSARHAIKVGWYDATRARARSAPLLTYTTVS